MDLFNSDPYELDPDLSNRTEKLREILIIFMKVLKQVDHMHLNYLLVYLVVWIDFMIGVKDFGIYTYR